MEKLNNIKQNSNGFEKNYYVHGNYLNGQKLVESELTKYFQETIDHLDKNKNNINTKILLAKPTPNVCIENDKNITLCNIKNSNKKKSGMISFIMDIIKLISNIGLPKETKLKKNLTRLNVLLNDSIDSGVVLPKDKINKIEDFIKDISPANKSLKDLLNRIKDKIQTLQTHTQKNNNRLEESMTSQANTATSLSREDENCDLKQQKLSNELPMLPQALPVVNKEYNVMKIDLDNYLIGKKQIEDDYSKQKKAVEDDYSKQKKAVEDDYSKQKKLIKAKYEDLENKMQVIGDPSFINLQIETDQKRLQKLNQYMINNEEKFNTTNIIDQVWLFLSGNDINKKDLTKSYLNQLIESGNVEKKDLTKSYLQPLIDSGNVEKKDLTKSCLKQPIKSDDVKKKGLTKNYLNQLIESDDVKKKGLTKNYLNQLIESDDVKKKGLTKNYLNQLIESYNVDKKHIEENLKNLESKLSMANNVYIEMKNAKNKYPIKKKLLKAFCLVRKEILEKKYLIKLQDVKKVYEQEKQDFEQKYEQEKLYLLKAFIQKMQDFEQKYEQEKQNVDQKYEQEKQNINAIFKQAIEECCKKFNEQLSLLSTEMNNTDLVKNLNKNFQETLQSIKDHINNRVVQIVQTDNNFFDDLLINLQNININENFTASMKNVDQKYAKEKQDVDQKYAKEKQELNKQLS